jgi:dCMP deaminase
VKSTNPEQWERTSFWFAEQISKRATCPRRSVGCLIIRPHGPHVVGGYNGAAEGIPTCLEEGCLEEGGHCVRAVHAEIRAITTAVKAGVSLDGCIAYVTLLPCINCMQALLESGIREIHYDQKYARDEANHLFRFAESAGVQLIERQYRD